MTTPGDAMGKADDNSEDVDGVDDPIKCTRRQALLGAASAAGALLAATACSSSTAARARSAATANPDVDTWEGVRAEFDADEDLVHMAAMLLATHPRAVRDAISEHRRGLDDNPVDYLFEHWARSEEQLDGDAEQRVMEAAGRHLDIPAAHIALTHNTTTGLAMVYNGLDISPDQEVLSAHWNHWASEGSIQYAAEKRGFSHRTAHLTDDLQATTAEELTDRLVDEIAPETRVVAATWVHSDTGLKLPIGAMGRRIDELNRDRSRRERILFCVDGVHGFGVEDFRFADLHCDFFIAGCHKWLFGPRGTGIIAARSEAWHQATPTIPTFSMSITQGRRFTPGGFHAFEHRWALEQAFEFHHQIDKTRIAQRTHELSGRIAQELNEMPHVHLTTPLSPDLRSGIVVFRVDGHGTYQVIDHLRRQGIVASISTGDVRQPRLSPSILNDHADIDAVVDALWQLR